jgi:hypothetical protein
MAFLPFFFTEYIKSSALKALLTIAGETVAVKLRNRAG